MKTFDIADENHSLLQHPSLLSLSPSLFVQQPSSSRQSEELYIWPACMPFQHDSLLPSYQHSSEFLKLHIRKDI